MMQAYKNEAITTTAPLDIDAAMQKKKRITDLAHEQAENDIEKDVELNPVPTAEDDLDEGELARLKGGE